METSKFTVEISQDLVLQVKRLPKKAQQWIDRDIKKKLQVNPEGYGLPLSGKLHGLHKLRVNVYRIIYEIDRINKVVSIVDIDYRRDVYD